MQQYSKLLHITGRQLFHNSKTMNQLGKINNITQRKLFTGNIRQIQQNGISGYNLFPNNIKTIKQFEKINNITQRTLFTGNVRPMLNNISYNLFSMDADAVFNRLVVLGTIGGTISGVCVCDTYINSEDNFLKKIRDGVPTGIMGGATGAIIFGGFGCMFPVFFIMSIPPILTIVISELKNYVEKSN